MKYKSILYIFLFLYTSHCLSQKKEGIITYKVKTDFSFKTKNEKEKEVLKKVFNSSKQDELNFYLIFKDNKNVFFADKKMKIDGSGGLSFVNSLAKITGKIYTNLKTKKIIQHKEKFGVFYNIETSFSENDWILTNKTASFGKYLCRKAILKNEDKNKKNKTYAWFTHQIPINLSPSGFFGLPGLVVMLKNDVFIYSLQKIEFSIPKDKKNLINKPKKGINVTKKQYDSIYKVMRKNYYK